MQMGMEAKNILNSSVTAFQCSAQARHLFSPRMRLCLFDSTASKTLRHPHHHAAEHLDQPAVGVINKTRVAGVQINPLTVSSFSPIFRTVSIIPGMENLAPERQETSNGLSRSPNFLPCFFYRLQRVQFLSHISGKNSHR